MIKDLSEVGYADIKQFEVAISSASGEGLKVRFDLDKELLTWNDGYMWNNNFMKGINGDKLSYLRENLPATHMLEWMLAYNNGFEKEIGHATANPSIWQIKVYFSNDETLSSTSCQHFPNDWPKLKKIIETMTECSFRLR